jgi:hypothetical protein
MMLSQRQGAVLEVTALSMELSASVVGFEFDQTSEMDG